MFKNSAKALTKPKTISTAAMMVALYAALYMAKIPIAVESRVSMTFLPIAVSGFLLGPVPAMIVGAVGDVVAFLLFPSGSYFPGFTISAMISGIIYGICLYRCPEQKFRQRAVLSNLIITVVVNICLNTLWVSILYEKAFVAYLVSRLVKNLITFPLQIIVTIIILDILVRTGITKKYP